MQPIIYICIAIVGWASWAVLNKTALNHLNPMALQFITSLFSFPLSFLYWQFVPKDTRWTSVGIGWTIAAAVATFGGSLAYMYAASQKEVSSVISLTACYPALTFLLAVMFLGETFTMTKFGGLVLILLGVWVVSK